MHFSRPESDQTSFYTWNIDQRDKICLLNPPRVELCHFSFHYNRTFSFVLTSFFACTNVTLTFMLPLNQSSYVSNKMSSVILIQLIKPHGFISAVNAKHPVFKPFNKQKMGTPLCDATMTLKQQEKIVNIFFLKQNIFFYKKMYVYHFYQKMHAGLTQRPALQPQIKCLVCLTYPVFFLPHNYIKCAV